jgi:hypothetical protein
MKEKKKKKKGKKDGKKNLVDVESLLSEVLVHVVYLPHIHTPVRRLVHPLKFLPKLLKYYLNHNSTTKYINIKNNNNNKE